MGLNLEWLLRSILSIVLSLVLRKFLTYYFDSKKWEAYYTYSVIIFINLMLDIPYILLMILYVDQKNTWEMMIFVIALSVLILYNASIILALSSLVNNFTIFRNKDDELLEKRSKNNFFFRDLIMVRTSSEINNSNQFINNYQQERYHYQDNDNNNYYVYVFNYRWTIFKRLIKVCPKLFVVIVIVYGFMIIFNLVSLLIKYQHLILYINSNLLVYIILIINSLALMLNIVLFSRIYKKVSDLNKKEKIFIMKILKKN